MDPDVLQPEVAPNVNVPPPSMPDVSDVPGAAPVGPPPNVLAGSVQSNVQPPQSGLRHFITQATGSLLSGTVPHYYHDETGNLQVEHVKERPGQLFRRILASSILGGAVGAESGPSGIKGALRGAQAVGDKSEAMDAQARQRADQDFLARQKVAQEQREQQRLGMEQTRLGLDVDKAGMDKQMFAANIAHANLANKALDQQIDQAGFKFAQDQAQEGKAIENMYAEAGQSPVVKATGADAMAAAKQHDPALSKLRWEVVGLDFVDGKPQKVYAAFDPDVTTTVTPEVAGMWKKAGVNELVDGKNRIKLDTGTKLTAPQLNLVHQMYIKKRADLLDVQKTDNEKQLLDAQLGHLNAQTNLANAQATEAGNKNNAFKRDKAIQKAEDDFGEALKANKDPLDAFKTLPASQQAMVETSFQTRLPAINSSIKEIGDELKNIDIKIQTATGAEQSELAKRRLTLTAEQDQFRQTAGLINRMTQTRAGGVVPAAASPAQTVAPKPPAPKAALTPDAVKWFGDNYPTRQAAYAAAAKEGWSVPAQYAPVAPTPTSSETMAQIQAKSAARKALDSQIGPDYKSKIEAARKKGDTKSMSSLMNEYTQKLDAAQ